MCIRDSSSTMVYSEVYNMLYFYPEDYYGNTVTANGIFAIYQMVVDGVTPVSYTHLDVYKRQG